MSDITMDQVTNYLEKMAATLTGDRGQTHSDLCKLLGIIRGDVSFSGPGIQPLAPVGRRNIQMTPTAATPKSKTKTKKKAKKKTEATAEGAEA